MKNVFKLLTWKRCIYFSIAVLTLLIVFSFYGLYSNTFYVLKPDNYIFPLLTLVHFTFLYVLWFKIEEDELTDPLMRNVEYTLYVICLVYLYEAFETARILMTYSEFENYVIPETFLPMGTFILSLQILLLMLTLISFKYRKDFVGAYTFDNINQHIDSWE
ncbi:hypothetical protein [Pareuzebyella sediminis]|uniref:hypothetical protein n=1 Tax=Pareuzebyella sediminis TaxID=2607998 RepID=UPI0011EFF212|nr:hypothetical protein [Pareuzebyella sediminis]